MLLLLLFCGVLSCFPRGLMDWGYGILLCCITLYEKALHKVLSCVSKSPHTFLLYSYTN